MLMEEGKEFKRFFAKEVSIKDVDPAKHPKVRIVATIISVGKDSVVVDDGTGTAQVFIDGEGIAKLSEKQMVRVIGRVLPVEDGFEIHAEAVSDMTGLDMERYGKARKLWEAQE